MKQTLPYPAKYLKTQYNNWLLVNEDNNHLIMGGYAAYTSEGFGFQALLAAGMLTLDKNDQQALTSLKAVYDFIYPNNGDTQLVNGLLPWSYDADLNVREQYSATDADIMLALGFYKAGKLLNNEDYVKAGTDMMQAIHNYDTTNLNGAVFLNQGGANAGSDRNKAKNGIAGIAYTKTYLSFLAEFANADSQTKDDWNKVIQNTLDAMQVIQMSAKEKNSYWGGVLGFMDQGLPGAAYVKYSNGEFSTDDSTFINWTFNYDAGRVPLILGDYLLTARKLSNQAQQVSTILDLAMGSASQNGLNTAFYGYGQGKYKVYLPEEKDGITYAYIFKKNQAQPMPNQDDPNAYVDDFLNASFLLGNLGQTGWGESSDSLTPAKAAAIQLMSSSSGGYYGGAYKIMTGLMLDGAYTDAQVLINRDQYVADHTTAPTKFNSNTRVVVQADPNDSKGYYRGYTVTPAIMKKDTSYLIKLEAKFQGKDKYNVQSWGGVMN